MKSIIAVVGLLLAVGCADAQKGIPSAVTVAFAKEFPKATKVKWEKEDANFEAEFVDGSKEYSAVFSAEGKLMETESEIAINELPAAVQDFLTKNYPGQKVKEAAKITKADGSVVFEAEIKGKDLLFDTNGNVLP